MCLAHEHILMKVILRTPSDHCRQCIEVQGSNDLSASIEYGINRRAAFEDLPGFSVIDCLPHDFMHDLLEGVVPREVKMLIEHCIKNGFFQVTTLNQRLLAFDFGYSELADKPAVIENNLKIRQSSSQMWLLIRILPFLLGDLIPRNNLHWQCFLKLLEICDIATAPSISKDSAAYLQLLIEEHHIQFCEVYGSSSVIPKMHFMIHYPSQILRFGPLVHS